MELGKILKDLRLEAGLKQKDLAIELEIGQSTIAGYENNGREPTLTNLMKYAGYFKVSLDYLVGLEDDFGTKIEQKDFLSQKDDKSDKQLDEFLKLYEVMNELQKAQVKGFMAGTLESGGVNVKKILNGKK